MSARIVDTHLHLEHRLGLTAAQAADQLVADMDCCGVCHGVLLHLLWQPWSVDEVAAALAAQPKLTGFINVIPQSPTAAADLDRGVALGFKGLKLHPRLQHYLPDSPECIALVRKAGDMGLPVVVDCFPDGDWLMDGHTVLHYARLAKAAPQTKIIVAHFAGHHCIDMMMLGKRVPNLWFDVAYAWLYYGESVVADMAYALRGMRYERVLFGTDYPYHNESVSASVKRSLDLLERFGITGEARDKLLWKNAYELLQMQ